VILEVCDDGAKVVLKTFIKHSQLDPNGPKLQNAQDIIFFMCEHLFSWRKTSYSKVRKLVPCVFFGLSSFQM
jgi:hypothetical protein